MGVAVSDMLFLIPAAATQLYPERPIGYTTPRQNGALPGQGYFLPGWKPEYPTNALPISGPDGPWGTTSDAYWQMAPNDFSDGSAVDCTDYKGCWQVPP